MIGSVGPVLCLNHLTVRHRSEGLRVGLYWSRLPDRLVQHKSTTLSELCQAVIVSFDPHVVLVIPAQRADWALRMSSTNHSLGHAVTVIVSLAWRRRH